MPSVFTRDSSSFPANVRARAPAGHRGARASGLVVSLTVEATESPSIGARAQSALRVPTRGERGVTDASARPVAHHVLVRSLLVPVVVALALASGLVLKFAGESARSRTGSGPSCCSPSSCRSPSRCVRRMLRGQLGADVIALLAIAGSLALGEFEAGLVVALMLSGGELLDDRAFRRARRELAALAERAPAVAHRHEGARLVDVPAADVARATSWRLRRRDRARGLHAWRAVRRCSTKPRSRASLCPRGAWPATRSAVGRASSGEAIEVRALRPAAASTYARIVRLVEQAEADRPRTARLADRAAVVFLPITLLVAGARLGRFGLGGRGARGSRRGHSVPAHPGHAYRLRLGTRPRRPARHRRQGRHAARAPGRGHGRRVRQDGDADRRLSPGRRGAATTCSRLAAAAEAESAHPLAAAIRAEAGLRNLELAEAR